MDDTRAIHDLRQRIADYRRWRRMTTDKQFLEAVDRMIAECQERLRLLESSAPAMC